LEHEMPKATSLVSKETNKQSLVQGNDYVVIGLDESDFRIIDESGEICLYPKSYFLDVDFTPPSDWILISYGEGSYSFQAPEFSAKGFYENFEDGEGEAIKTFEKFKQKLKARGTNS